MLGQVFLWLSERQNRKYVKYIEHIREKTTDQYIRKVIECIQSLSIQRSIKFVINMVADWQLNGRVDRVLSICLVCVRIKEMIN